MRDEINEVDAVRFWEVGAKIVNADYKRKMVLFPGPNKSYGSEGKEAVTFILA
ncbi:MAG TPA: hypothetical protein VF133_03580 [Terriglobales bacterium]